MPTQKIGKMQSISLIKAFKNQKIITGGITSSGPYI